MEFPKYLIELEKIIKENGDESLFLLHSKYVDKNLNFFYVNHKMIGDPQLFFNMFETWLRRDKNILEALESLIKLIKSENFNGYIIDENNINNN